MLCLSAQKALKKAVLRRCLSGHDIIDISENPKLSKINNS
jgi:hypothetical protein